jgi:adenosylcobinamide-phosphate synthase
MGFFAILIALLLEQARPLAPNNLAHAAMRSWTRTVRRNIDTGHAAQGWLAWSLAVGVPSLAAVLIYWTLWSFSSVLGFAWLVVVLYLTLGFRQFSHHFREIRLALEEGDEAQARRKLAAWLRVEAGSLPRAELLRQVIQHSVLSAHRHVFGVLVAFVVLWMLGLGPAGAILYRMAEYLSRNWQARADNSRSPSLQMAAARAWTWVDHFPARATAVAFAVVGNFEEAVASWRSDAALYAAGSDGVVLAATSGALNVRLAPRAPASQAPVAVADTESVRPEPQLAHLSGVVGLVWRAVVLWMLVLVLLSLARLPI